MKTNLNFIYSNKDYKIEDYKGKLLSTRKQHQILKDNHLMYKDHNNSWQLSKKINNGMYYKYIHIKATPFHNAYDYQLWTKNGFQKLNELFTNLGFFIPNYIPKKDWGKVTINLINRKQSFKKQLIKDCNNTITKPKLRKKLEHQLTKHLPLKQLKLILITVMKTKLKELKKKARKENTIDKKYNRLHKILSKIPPKSKRKDTPNQKTNHIRKENNKAPRKDAKH